MAAEPDIILYTSGTPNGQKASITLEELGLSYKVKSIEISKNVQKEDWFLRINPNGRIPALVDRTPTEGGKTRETRIFESGAMMLYLCERYDPEHQLNYSYDSDEYWEVVEWLIWMQSGLGPMQVCSILAVVTQSVEAKSSRVKPIIFTDMLLRRSSMVSGATRPRPSVFIKSLKTALKRWTRSTTPLQAQTLLGRMAHGSLVTR